MTQIPIVEIRAVFLEVLARKSREVPSRLREHGDRETQTAVRSRKRENLEGLEWHPELSPDGYSIAGGRRAARKEADGRDRAPGENGVRVCSVRVEELPAAAGCYRAIRRRRKEVIAAGAA